MPAPIQRPSLYYLFHCKSKDLSTKEQKKFKFYNIILGCFLPGIGHAICGIAYLIQKSCAKTSKTNQVAQNQLNRQNADEAFRIFKEKFQECFKTFHENQYKPEDLEKFEVVRVLGSNSGEQVCSYPIEKEKAFDELIAEIYADTRTSLGTFTQGFSTLILSISSKVHKNGFQTIVSATLTLENGKFQEATGPIVRKI